MGLRVLRAAHDHARARGDVGGPAGLLWHPRAVAVGRVADKGVALIVVEL